MTRRKLIRNPRTLTQVGLLFIVLASLSLRFLRPGPGLSEDVTDAITGFLYGIAIATTLMGIWKMRRVEKH